MKQLADLKIAIVHDSIRYFGGAERVLAALHQIFPEATIFTSIVSWSDLGPFRRTVEKMNVKTSWAQTVPVFRKYPFLFRYLLPFIWGSFDLSSYDLIISSSGAQMANLVKVKSPAIHICYCHTPPRHLYGYKTDYDWNNIFFVKIISGLLNSLLRRYSESQINGVDLFIANSQEVAGRIKLFYKKNAIVIYPPVLTKLQLQNSRKNGAHYLTVSRLSRMKHVDLIIKACNTLNVPLHVVGIGPEESRLKQISGPTIIFLGQINDRLLNNEYRNCKALICAAEDEDFGITPIEAMSFGKPVIAYYSGGYKETVVANKTGLFFSELSAEHITKAMSKLNNLKNDNFDYLSNLQRFTFSSFRFGIIHNIETLI